MQYIYDKYQRIIKTIDEEDNETSYEHDPNGNVIAVISPLGMKTLIKYDALDRQEEITEADGAITKLAYDKAGNVTQITDALGNVTRREYDLANQLTKLTDPLGSETAFSYTSLGQIESITNAEEQTTTYSYYPGGKVKSVTLPSGESESYTYDKNGNTTSITDKLGAKTELKYDKLDRVIETINPLGYMKKFSYDAIGKIIGITDENGNTAQYKYDVLGNVIEVIDALGHSTKYGYDAASRLTKLEQYRLIADATGSLIPEPQITTYTRNKKGEVVEVTSPLDTVVRYSYNEIGQVVSKTDEDYNETLYEYNLANQLSKVSYADGKEVEMSYNPLRQLTEMKDWLGITKIEVDPLGRATKVTDANNQDVCYSWNNLGQKETLTYPDGKVVNYTYDPSGKLEVVHAPDGTTRYSYDPIGRLKERISPDGIATKYEVSALGKLTGLTHSQDGFTLDSFQYSYDPAGNITGIEKQRHQASEDSGLFSYGYDPVGRLISAKHNDKMNTYTYDNLGNRISGIQNGVETTYSYNARNQLIRTTEPEVESSYSYDERGNLRKIVENIPDLRPNVSKFVFDATNMMTRAETGKGSATYTYDGFRNRVGMLEKLSDPGIPDPVREVKFTLDRTLPYDNLLATDGTSKQSFVWGNGLLSSLAGKDGFFYLQDHLGGPARLIGDAGLSEALAFDEFGSKTLSGEDKFANPFSFTGYMGDSVSGLLFAQNRFYSADQGRFIAEDPICSGMNWYEYCGGNPVVFTDSAGLEIDDIAANNNFFSNALDSLLSPGNLFGLGASGVGVIFNQVMQNVQANFDARAVSLIRPSYGDNRIHRINNQLRPEQAQISGIRVLGNNIFRFLPAIGVGIDVGVDLRRDMRNDDISDHRVATNAVANTVMSGGSAWAQAWAAAKAGGKTGSALGPKGILVGAGVGMGLNLVGNIPIGDQTIREHVQDGFYRSLRTAYIPSEVVSEAFDRQNIDRLLRDNNINIDEHWGR
ncbi:MAG: hypothetical protein FWE32_07420 [Oscillospiraceae bacterium]|nr:hypothetical protein [Oscillospiraceae bacterium]